MGSKSLGVLLFSFVALISVPSQAQSNAEKDTARSLMDEGDARRDKNDLKAALAAYEKADAIMRVPTTGIEVGRTQAQLGMLLEARETFKRVIRIPMKDKEPTAFINARKAADQLNDELAKRIPALQLVISGVSPGQIPEVTVDKEPLSSALLNVPRKVNPGAHTIVARAGSSEKTVEVSVVERETKTVNIDLTEPKTVGSADVSGDTSTPSDDATPKILMFGGFGLAVVGAGVGAVTGLMSMSKVSDIKADCVGGKCPQSRASDIDSAKTLGNVSTIAFAAAGIGAAVGIVGLVMMSGRTEKAPRQGTSGTSALVKTTPVVGVGAGYVGLSGAF